MAKTSYSILMSSEKYRVCTGLELRLHLQSADASGYSSRGCRGVDVSSASAEQRASAGTSEGLKIGGEGDMQNRRLSNLLLFKIEKIQEDTLDSIPSPSSLMEIQIICRKVYLR